MKIRQVLSERQIRLAVIFVIVLVTVSSLLVIAAETGSAGAAK
jgi:hypothetical protein